MIETERLILRAFREDDREPFAAINGDPRVSDWLGGPISRAASDATIDRINSYIVSHGHGFFAAERNHFWLTRWPIVVAVAPTTTAARAAATATSFATATHAARAGTTTTTRTGPFGGVCPVAVKP